MKRLVVLGSGRSATSLVAKGLHDAGVNMGAELIGPGPSNPAGHFEDRALVRLNDRILVSAGGSWCQPPEITPELVDIFAPHVTGYLEERERLADGTPWGMKDPRLVLTWPAWWPHLRYLPNLVLVPVWRSPDEIAASLEARERRPPPAGTWRDLADTYHERLRSILADAAD